jgi:hypothetical protein
VDVLKKIVEIYTCIYGDAVMGAPIFKRVHELADEHIENAERLLFAAMGRSCPLTTKAGERRLFFYWKTAFHQIAAEF